jgi:NTP pyrophosphatase (non-canonical NTP hydrolase)
MDPENLQRQLHEWRQLNFPNSDAAQQLLGVVEEVGELSHAVLKQIQGIRGDEQLHENEMKDAIGDIVVSLAGFCSYKGWSLWEIYDDTANFVLERDWVGDPLKGDPA